MTQDEIIKIARQAGFIDADWNMWMVLPHLEAFAKLVAQHEREACAGIVVNEAMQYAEPVWAFEIVNDIKARGQA
jgi:hypothetical protein